MSESVICNPHLRNLSRVEFVITWACTGRCKHCCQGEHEGRGNTHVSPEIAARTVGDLCAHYPITSVMTFGGEPLLHPETVCAIHAAARDCGVAKRQVITNGYFTKDPSRMDEVARALAESGVNDLLLSVDAVHQETIPPEAVKTFARSLLTHGVPVRTQPAWVVNEAHENPYNRTTRAILGEFAAMGITANTGNDILPEGNAATYLAEYYDLSATYVNPYADDPFDLRTVTVDPDGTCLCGNINRSGVMELVKKYLPNG